MIEVMKWHGGKAREWMQGEKLNESGKLTETLGS